MHLWHELLRWCELGIDRVLHGVALIEKLLLRSHEAIHHRIIVLSKGRPRSHLVGQMVLKRRYHRLWCSTTREFIISQVPSLCHVGISFQILDPKQIIVEFIRDLGHFLEMVFLQPNRVTSPGSKLGQGNRALKGIADLSTVPDRSCFAAFRCLFVKELFGVAD